MHPPSAQPGNAIQKAAKGIVSALGEARDITELGEIFAIRIKSIGYHSAGYLRIYGEGRFHTAEYLFGDSVAGWSERYQTKRYSINDPVFITSCRSTGAFKLEEVAGPSRDGALILADSRSHGLFDGLVTPFRASYDEVGFVLLGSDNQVNLHDYERFLLQGMCETYARLGMALLPVRADPPALTRRESECLRWVAAGRSDPQIGMLLGLSANTIHAHVEAAKTKLGANSRAQLVLRAAMAGILRAEPS